MSRDRVRHVDGIPRWFTYLMHLTRRRKCRKSGHDGGLPRVAMAASLHEDRVRRAIAADPPLSADQCARLTALLQPPAVRKVRSRAGVA